MNISIDQKQLSEITSLVYRAAASKSTIPALSGVLMEAGFDFGLRLTATDMEIGMQVSTSNVEIIEAGTLLVNASYFYNLIKSLPDSKIGLKHDKEKARLIINYGRSAGHINTYSEYEYPSLPIKELQPKISLPQNVLREALRKTSPAAAISHFRQVFTGVLFDLVEGNKLKVIASDTHRLACFEFDYEQETTPFRFLIPLRTANELARVIEESDEIIDIACQDNNVVFYREGFLLYSRLIEGQYPAYEQVIPASFSSEVTIKTSILAEILERARTMPRDESLKIQYIQMSINQEEVSFYASSEKMGELDEKVEKAAIKGETEMKITFNTNYLLDAVRILQNECEEIVIKLSGPLGAAMIINPNNEKYVYILVPLRTSN